MPEEFGETGSTADQDRSSEDLLVVGIGASAGGISALKRFFAEVPATSGAAYAVILHLSPDHESKLSEVLQASTPLPIEQVQGRVPLAPDHVYVIAPNARLAIADGHIVSAPVTHIEERRAPVDFFFRTLADAYGRNAVGVVLSGTGPDGSSGLKRVKEHGGLAIAQDPSEAEHADMPTNSIATGLVDYVLPVAQIPGQVLEYHARFRKVSQETPRLAFATSDEEGLRDIMTQLRVRTSHDFSNYKPSTMVRRIQRRMSVLAIGTLPEYAVFMKQHPDEPPMLMKELLISVTNFFRDRDVFGALEQHTVPRLFHGKQGGDQIRVWVAGCATGEEAYSVAMLLAEYASTIVDPPRIQVFASDLDERAIAVAREGFYTMAEVADVSPERLHRFFQPDSGGYRVRRELREIVLFALHNLVKDPPFSQLDLLACRNLLIYLNRSIQDRVIATLHFALRPGGFLLLGTSESPDDASNLFATIDKEAHLYQARPVASRPGLPLGEPTLPRPAPEQRTPVAPVPERVFPIDLHHRLIEEYAPPSLVVTDEHVLVHVSENGGQYLQIGRGEPTRNVVQLVHADLRMDLRTALHTATHERTNVTVRGVRFTPHGDRATITIVVRPVLRDGDPARGFFLIVFEEEVSTSTPPPDADVMELQSPAAREDPNLEEELRRTKSQLGMTIEQYETQVEEAKASNEELQAANEELRSTTEELETSKEELQSVNEELTTANQELKIKIEELRVTNNDFRNFINATNIPTVFLDRGLRVKLPTMSAREIFNLLPTDVGRRLSDITSQITYAGILDDASHVLERLTTVEREVQTAEGRRYIMRVQPYRTLDDRIEGVVLTFVDVTMLRRAEAEVFSSEQRLRLLIDSAIDYAIFTMTDEGRIDSWNAGAERLWGYKAADIIGKSFADLFTSEDRAAGIPEAELMRARQDGRALDERFHQRQDGTTFYASGVTTRLGEDARLGFAKIARDLTAPRDAADALRRAHGELEDRVVLRTSELQQEGEHVRGLLKRLVTAQEDQRTRLARDLHDQLGQQLTALRLTLERGQKNRAAGRDPDDELARGLALTAEITKEVDFLAWELRPAVLDDLGLAAALPRFLREWSHHYSIEGEFRVSGFTAGDLSNEAEVTFYRIAQEALNNVLKHAHASRVDVVLETRDGQVRLVVSDDGVGYDMTDSQGAHGGFGIIGMKERAALVGARLEVESTLGQGTTVYLRANVAEHSEEAGR